MNYLAHCWLSGDAPHLLEGAFLGDFIKGRLEHIAPLSREALLKHRQVDIAADSFMALNGTFKLFPTSLQREAKIICDLAFDHVLALRWSEFHDQSLTDYGPFVARRVYAYPIEKSEYCKAITQQMQHHQLFLRYRSMDSIIAIAHRMEGRTKYPLELGACAEHLPLVVNDLNQQLTPLLQYLQASVYATEIIQ